MKFSIPSSSAIPHLDQYFGIWAMEEVRFSQLADRASTFDVTLHLQKQSEEKAENGEAKASRKDAEFEIVGDIAVIELEGTLMKHVSSFTNGTSTIFARNQIRNARNSEDIAGILLRIDSPGGTVAGTQELAKEVAVAKQKKPVVTFFEDLGASAAYWVGSQASKAFANEAGLVGSIGTFGVVHDLSGMAAKEGIKVHVIKAGEFKGAGTPGTEITPEMLAEAQRTVNQLNELFVEGVRDGRRMTLAKVRDLNDGRVHIAADATELALIDGVQTFDETFETLIKLSEPIRRQRAMSQPATYEQIKTECVGATSEFICEQLERKATLEGARNDWMAHQALQIEQQQKELQAAREAAAAAQKETAKPSPGVTLVPEPPARASASHDSDPISEWNQTVETYVKQGMSRQAAVSTANKRHPELREEMLHAYNELHGRKTA